MMFCLLSMLVSVSVVYGGVITVSVPHCPSSLPQHSGSGTLECSSSRPPPIGFHAPSKPSASALISGGVHISRTTSHVHFPTIDPSALDDRTSHTSGGPRPSVSKARTTKSAGHTPSPPVLITITTRTTVAGRFYASTTTATGFDATATVVISSPRYGMAYNAYNNPFNPSRDPNWQDDFDNDGVQYLRNNNRKLVSCGIAQDVNLLNDDVYTSINGYLPGQTTLTDMENIAVVYHGWFLPPVSGTYKFASISQAFGYIWVGQLAFTRWTNTNFNGSSSVDGPNVGNPIDLTEGVPVPVTLLYANAGGRLSCFFRIKFPDSTFVHNFTGLFVQPQPGDVWIPPVFNPKTCLQPPTAVADGNSG